MQRLDHIVLIHGAHHGAFCWEAVVPLLTAKGYRVSTPDLPGLGADETPVANVSYQRYVDRVVDAVQASGEPVLLLGHSMGGAVVCGAAEAVSEHIGKLVILAGLVPRDGESMGEATREFFPTFSQEPAADGMLDFDPAYSADIFYNTCPAQIRGTAVARLRRQAAAPFGSPIHLSTARFGKVPKTYIVCTRDQATPVAAQNAFCARVPDMARREIHTDHSPFYSDPAGLATLIDAEARPAGA